MNFTQLSEGELDWQRVVVEADVTGPVEILSPDGSKRVAVLVSPDDYATLRECALQLDVMRARFRGDWPK